MNRNHPTRRLLALLLLLLGVFALHSPGFASNGGDDDDNGSGNDDALKLRMNDAIAPPGGNVALVIRTYASRPLRQGRITVRVSRPPSKALLGVAAEDIATPARPLTLQRVVVFSANGDAVAQPFASNEPSAQEVGVQFTSSSGSVNASDGPLAVLFLKLANDVSPGQVFEVVVDPAETGLTAANGAPVAVEPIAAELSVRAGKAPYTLEAEGDEVEPGETAELGLETYEVFGIKSGKLTLRYDPQALGGTPVVRMDPRYGRATFRVDLSRPGVLVVEFQSPNAQLNSVPGRIIDIAFPTNPAAPLGWRTAITVDRANTWLVGKKGNRRLPVRIEDGELEFADD